MHEIVNHRFAGVPFIASPNLSGVISPKFIVMHYTAGWTGSSAINTLTSRGSNASAHIVIDEIGRVVQLVPLNRKAWHAGPSRYWGYTGLNSHSIGIEIVNMGYLKRLSDGRLLDDAGGVHTEKQGRLKGVSLIEAKHYRVGSGTYYWPAYTEQQIKQAESVSLAIMENYNIRDVISHEEIDTRGWKTDPGPAFPMASFKRLLQTRNLASNKFVVTASSLNVRCGPSSNYDRIASLPRGAIVDDFDRDGSWVKVSPDGWVHGGYLRAA